MTTITGFEHCHNGFILVILSFYITSKHPIHDRGSTNLTIDSSDPIESDKSLMTLPFTGWKNSMVHHWLLLSLEIASNGSSLVQSSMTAAPKYTKRFGYAMHWKPRMVKKERSAEVWMMRMND